MFHLLQKIIWLLVAGNLSAATVYTAGGGNSNIANAANWSNGTPSLSNAGVIGAVHVTTYGNQNALSSLNLTLEAQASLSGGGARVTDSLLFLKNNTVWQASNTVTLGRNAGSTSGTQLSIMDSAQFTTSGNLWVGRNQHAQVSQSGGSVSVARNLGIGQAAGGASSSYSILGGDLTVGRDVIVRRSSTFAISGGNVSIARNLRLRNQGSNVEVSGGVTHVQRNIILQSNNTFITQTEGEVIVDNRLVMNGGNSRVYQLKGGRLSVRSRIIVSGNNTFVWETGGVLAVHTSGSFINYRGNLTADTGAILDLDSSTQYLDVSGTLVINGLEINGYDLMLADHANPDGVTAETGCYLHVEAGTLTVQNLTFTNFTDSTGSLINQGDSFNPLTQTVYWHEVVGNEIRTCWSVAPVPEPSSCVLLVLASACFLRVRVRW